MRKPLFKWLVGTLLSVSTNYNHYNCVGDDMYRKVDSLYSKDLRTGSRKQCGTHFHNAYELYFLLNGTVKYLINGKFFYLNPGDLIIIPPKAIHSADSEECFHNERLLIMFDASLFFSEVEEYLNSLCEENIICVPKEKLPLLEDMFYKIGNEDKNRTDSSNILIKSYISELIIYLHRYKAPPKYALNETDLIIRKIAEYIFENYDKDLSLGMLSRRFSLSECYLSRKFKSETGSSINQYINSVRISRAKDLLKQPFTSITQVATLCGFNDSNYFSDVFKKINGITPLKYSKKYKT